MGKGQLLIIFCIVFAAAKYGNDWRNKKSQESMMAKILTMSPEEQAKLGVPKNCDGKKYCMTVFIAPWCGVCQNSEPTFKAMHEILPRLRPDVGFGVVIGADSPSNNAQKRMELLPIDSFADDSDMVMNSKKIRAFPTWIIHDNTGKEVFRKAAGFNATSEAQIQQVFKEFFQI